MRAVPAHQATRRRQPRTPAAAAPGGRCRGTHHPRRPSARRRVRLQQRNVGARCAAQGTTEKQPCSRTSMPAMTTAPCSRRERVGGAELRGGRVWKCSSDYPILYLASLCSQLWISAYTFTHYGSTIQASLVGPWSHPSFVNCTRHALIGNIYWNRDWRFIHSLVMATLTLLSVRLQQVLRHLPHATHPSPQSRRARQTTMCATASSIMHAPPHHNNHSR